MIVRYLRVSLNVLSEPFFPSLREYVVVASASPNYCILNCAAQTATGSLLVFMQGLLNDFVLLGCTL